MIWISPTGAKMVRDVRSEQRGKSANWPRPKGLAWKGPVCVVVRSLRIAPDMLLTHASRPDPFEANGMPPTYDSMRECILLLIAHELFIV